MFLFLVLSFTACKSGKEVAFSEQNQENITADDAKQQSKQAASGAESDTQITGVETITEDEKKLEQSADPVIIIPESSKSNPDDSKQIDPSSAEAKGRMDYAAYVAMSAKDQYAYFKTFQNPDEFLAWYNKARDRYEKENPVHVINPGDVIDLGE